MLRALLGLCALVACSSPEPGHPARPRTAPADAAVAARAVPVAPASGRLPEGVAPLAYAVRLEVDPDREAFSGKVEIRTQLARATDVIWLHAGELDLTSATLTDGHAAGAALVVVPRSPTGDAGLRGLVLPRSHGPGEVTLTLAFRGRALCD